MEAEQKRVHARIDKLESIKGKVAWIVIGMVIMALASSIIKEG